MAIFICWSFFDGNTNTFKNIFPCNCFKQRIEKWDKDLKIEKKLNRKRSSTKKKMSPHEMAKSKYKRVSC